MSVFTFIDLFAGLGGFHLALQDLGGKCVFASELRADLQILYQINYPGTPIYGDIQECIADVPPHDVLCAGFPCQPFSQAGKREGFKDLGRGNLFYVICEIIQKHKPKYIFLENVANLLRHDSGNTWGVIEHNLTSLGYWIDKKIISPHEFGIPQHRRRIYIVCRRRDLGSFNDFAFPIDLGCKEANIKEIIDVEDEDITPIKPETREQLEIWQEFVDLTIAHGDNLPRFPIWAMEFGATYDFKDTCPAFQSLNDLIGKRGRLGKVITSKNRNECLGQLPNYAQVDKEKCFPNWKIRYIQQNREFYLRHKKWLDTWLQKVKDFDNSHLKFEWNCGAEATPTIEDKIVQFRASGIRVKLPTYSPALNLVGTQVPIFPWIEIPAGNGEKGRYMTLKEAARIQGMERLKFNDPSFALPLTRCYEALGNAVNVEVVKRIAQKLLLNHEK
ncbi:DNA cytosine methyltransferase [Porphyromonas loveana]|uniref:DNA cytosine methyltransferase n=1 Tax=Porphyromonas loveana TaxID=1884669 RepID=UPI00359FD8B2